MALATLTMDGMHSVAARPQTVDAHAPGAGLVSRATTPGQVAGRVTARALMHSARGRRVLVGLLLTAIVVGAALVAQLGCERMRATAPIGSTDSAGRVVTGYGWSLRPVGFTVRYADGTETSQLWW